MDNTALPASSSNPDKMHIIFDDFINDAIIDATNALIVYGPANLTPVILNNGICTIDTATIADSYGTLTVSTGTNSNINSKAVFQSSNGKNKIKCGISELTIEWRVRFPILSDTSGLLQYIARAGIQDGTAIGDPANGIYFYYKASASLNWFAYTRGASTSSSLDTGIAVAANTWYKLRIVVNAAGTNVNFFINNTYVGNLTTNITTANAMRLMAGVERINTGSNTNQARVMNLDWIYFKSLR